MSTIINSLYEETNDIVDKLESISEISLSSDAKRHFTKIFILASASYFEDMIQKIIISFVKNTSENNEYLINFVKKKAISMQYHTYFDWGEKNNPDKPRKSANTFFSLFGDSFKIKMNEILKHDEILEESMHCFIAIGHMRNILIHSNFAAYNNINKTIEEFYIMYSKALKFIDLIKDNLIYNE